MSDQILPKVDGHAHANGMATDRDVVRLAAKYGVSLPLFYTRDNTVTGNEAEAYYGIRADGSRLWRDHKSFHKAYDETVKLVRDPEDLKKIVKNHLLRAAAEGGVLTEILTSGFNNYNGVGDPYPIFRDDLLKIVEAVRESKQEANVEAFISLTAKRHVRKDGIGAAMQLLDAYSTFKKEYPAEAALITGFNLAGDENSIDSGIFKPVFERAKSLGLGLSCHAGETRPVGDIHSAVSQLGAVRIGHGLSAVDDTELMREWASKGIAFEQLFTSNETLYPGRFSEHPSRKLREENIPLILGTDDPGIFNCTIGGEYKKAEEVYGFDQFHLLQCTINGILHSFAPAEIKASLLQEYVVPYANAHGIPLPPAANSSGTDNEGGTGLGTQHKPGTYEVSGLGSYEVVTPYPEPILSKERPTIKVTIIASAATHDRAGKFRQLPEEYRFYAYLIGYRLAEAGLGQKIGVDIVWGGGENGSMGDVVWGAADAYRNHGIYGSNLCAINTKSFWDKRDNKAEINSAVKANIVVDGIDGGFSLRKHMMYDGADAAIVLPSGLGGFDEVASLINEKQQKIFHGPIIMASLPVPSLNPFSVRGCWDAIAKMVTDMRRGGTISSVDQELFSIQRAKFRLDDHANNLLKQLFDQLNIKREDLPASTPLDEIADSYVRHKSTRSCASKRKINWKWRSHFSLAQGNNGFRVERSVTPRTSLAAAMALAAPLVFGHWHDDRFQPTQQMEQMLERGADLACRDTTQSLRDMRGKTYTINGIEGRGTNYVLTSGDFSRMSLPVQEAYYDSTRSVTSGTKCRLETSQPL